MSEKDKLQRIIFETEDEIEDAYEEINRLGDRIDNLRSKIYEYQVEIMIAKKKMRENNEEHQNPQGQ